MALRATFKNISGVAFALSLATIPTTNAYADDTQSKPKETVSVTAIQNSKPSHETLIGKKVSRKEAFRASTNQIVYHVGEGIEGVKANILSSMNDNYPISAFRGGEVGVVTCFVGRRRCGDYEQSDVYDGTLSGIAELAYDKKFGVPAINDPNLNLRPKE